MTGDRYDDLDLWQVLCEWLATQPRQAAYPADVPDSLAHLTYIGDRANALVPGG